MSPGAILVAVGAYRGGKATEKIAEEFGVTAQTVRKHLRRAGVVMRKGRPAGTPMPPPVGPGLTREELIGRAVRVLASRRWAVPSIATVLGVAPEIVKENLPTSPL